MTFLRAALLGALVLVSGSAALASNQDVFLSTLKRFGITDSVEDSKRPCLCIGGNANKLIGMFRIYDEVGGAHGYDCEVPYYDAQGVHYASRFCLSQGGSDIVVLPK